MNFSPTATLEPALGDCTPAERPTLVQRVRQKWLLQAASDATSTRAEKKAAEALPLAFLSPTIHFLRRMPGLVVFALLLGIVAAIGWVDDFTGWGWSVSILYSIPIFLAVWWSGRRMGLFFAALCAFTWWLANHGDYPPMGELGYVLSATGRLFYFSIAAIGVAAITAKQEADEARIQALEDLRRLESDIVTVSEYEQQRIGQDLHDGICQQLAAIGCAVRVLADDLKSKNLVEADDAEKIELALQNSVSETRSLARGIFPVHVDRTGLSTALGDLAKVTSRMTGVPIEVNEWSEIHISDPQVAMHLYRIAQEAVSNALKHSAADEIYISLTLEGDILQLRVEDTGRGLPQGLDHRPAGMGLRTMHYRAQALGADLQITTRPQGGTLVLCTLKAPAPTDP